MKFQLKTLAAAAILAVAAGHASAAIPLNTTATGTGLLFYAFDDVTKTSYMQDLGQTYSSFLPTSAAASTSFSFNVAGNAAWNDYLASVGNDTSNTTWGVVAAISSNAAAVGQYGLLTTIRAGDSMAGQTTNKARSAVATPVRNWVLGVNAATSNVNPVNGFFTDITGAGNVAQSYGGLHTAAGNLVFKTDNFIGTSSTFNYLNSNTGTSPIVTTYANAFSFDGNNLNYAAAVAAVPEPSTYAMMVAGLMLVGGIAARRRNSAK